MSTQRRYVYYRVDAADLAAAVEAVRVAQSGLRREHPGLSAELLRRPEVREGQVTLMEVYGGDAGIAAEAVDAVAAAATERWRRGPRHLEVFSLV